MNILWRDECGRMKKIKIKEKNIMEIFYISVCMLMGGIIGMGLADILVENTWQRAIITGLTPLIFYAVFCILRKRIEIV